MESCSVKKDSNEFVWEKNYDKEIKGKLYYLGSLYNNQYCFEKKNLGNKNFLWKNNEKKWKF